MPAGLVIRVHPDEKIVAGQTDGPLLLTVTADVGLFPGKPPILPRSSKILARAVESNQAGRLRGRANYRLIIDSILTPAGCGYSIDAKLIQAGQFKTDDNAVIGNGHAKRDILALLFPPTTAYQLIRLPARGPKLVLDQETTLAIRLIQPVRPSLASDLVMNQTPSEAPRSFESQNGFLSRKEFDKAREAFEEVETPAKGLGIHFNEKSCAGCHLPAGDRMLSGGSGPTTELRAGHFGRNKEFIPAPGGTLITTQALNGATPEIKALSESENVRDRFITPTLFGAGFVECVDDALFRRIAQEQSINSNGRIRGLVRELPVLEAPGKTAVGRFGWAAQHASLLSFSADAYRNEIGITSPLEPNDDTFFGAPVDDGVVDPEDTGGQFGDDVELFTSFMRALPAPPFKLPHDDGERKAIEEGSRIFSAIGCSTCHVPELVTAKEGTWIDARTFQVPKALGNVKFHPYGDFLLHDIGTGPGILREGLPPEARGMIRTAALWGLGTRQANRHPLLHDGSARTLEDAISRHKNTAAPEAEKFRHLYQTERNSLLKFLRSL
jgi:CxxC motif-containing protein (DUF1111 family)